SAELTLPGEAAKSIDHKRNQDQQRNRERIEVKKVLVVPHEVVFGKQPRENESKSARSRDETPQRGERRCAEQRSAVAALGAPHQNDQQRGVQNPDGYEQRQVIPRCRRLG